MRENGWDALPQSFWSPTRLTVAVPFAPSKVCSYLASASFTHSGFGLGFGLGLGLQAPPRSTSPRMLRLTCPSFQRSVPMRKVAR